jgi:hypothetical protein
MQDPFNPSANYEVPKPESKYLKFEEGATEFLALASAVIGWEYWNKDGKPVRLSANPEEVPEDIRIDAKTGKPEAIKHFWAFPVIEVATGKVKILEITQKTVQKGILALVKSAWGNPVLSYSITVTRDDSVTPTSYSTMPNPKLTAIPTAWASAWDKAKVNGFDMTRLFRNADPFTPDEHDTVAPAPATAVPPVTTAPEVAVPSEPVDNEQPPN